jgi:signal peptidase
MTEDTSLPGHNPGAEPTKAPVYRRLLRHLLQVLLALAAAVLLVVVVGPRFLPYETLIVRSGSMSPTIPTGSVVLYHRQEAAKVKVGQIIAFADPQDPSIIVTHRVHAVLYTSKGRFFITKGDANKVPDAWRVPAEGTGWVEIYHVPYLGYALSWLSTLWARILFITLPAVGLGLLLLFEHRHPRENSTEALAT